MPNDHAEMSAVATALEDLLRRVSAAADRHSTDPDESLAHELYEVERALRTAVRRMTKVIRGLAA